MTTCYYAGSDRPRLVRGEHLAEGCECAGCLPCAHAHCRICLIAHSVGTCPECMAEVRESLREIGRMCDALPEEVEARGVEGEAMMLLGPAADPEARGHLGASVRVGRVPEDYLEEADGELHPLFVLGTWDMLVRDVLEHDEPTTKLTVASAIDYIDRQLSYLGGFEDLPFEDLARDLRACVRHMESVLHDGEQVDRGAPCMKCGVKVLRLTDDDGAVTYRCDRCRTDLSEATYMLAVKAEHIARADRLTANDMVIRTGVPAGTLRRWANLRSVDGIEYPPLFHSCGRNGQGRKVYRVSDVEEIRDSGGDSRGRTSNDKDVILSNEGAA